MSTTYWIRKCLFLLILVLTCAAPAFADPVVFTTNIDEELHFQLEATGGPINQLLQLTMVPTAKTPNEFWEYSIAVAETDFRPLASVDTVVVLISVKHLINPPGHADEGAGTPVNGLIFVTPFNGVVIQGGDMAKIQVTRTFSMVHGEHLDLLTAELIADVDRSNGGFRITAWTLTIDTIHTPEPATMLLLGTGLAGVAMKMRKKLKGRKTG